jgi:hypothetical protein
MPKRLYHSRKESCTNITPSAKELHSSKACKKLNRTYLGLFQVSLIISENLRQVGLGPLFDEALAYLQYSMKTIIFTSSLDSSYAAGEVSVYILDKILILSTDINEVLSQVFEGVQASRANAFSGRRCGGRGE